MSDQPTPAPEDRLPDPVTSDVRALPVSRVLPVYQQVANQLRDLIIRGTLSAGERLPSEAQMAAQFGVSRSTVREALRGLTAQQLVYTKRGVTGGTFIADPSAEHVRAYLETTIGLMSGADMLSVEEITEARTLFEVYAARLAARRANAQQLAEIRATLKPKSGPYKAADFNSHRHFHTCVIKATGNRLLEVIARPIYSVIVARFVREKVPHDFWEKVTVDHHVIYNAIASGDWVRAQELMRSHLRLLSSVYVHIDQPADDVGD